MSEIKEIKEMVEEIKKLKLNKLLEEANKAFNECKNKNEVIPTEIFEMLLKKEDNFSLEQFVKENKEDVENFYNNKFVKILITCKEAKIFEDFYNKIKPLIEKVIEKGKLNQELADVIGKQQ